MSNRWGEIFYYYNIAHDAVAALKRLGRLHREHRRKTAVTGQGGTFSGALSYSVVISSSRGSGLELPYGIRVNAVLPAEVMTLLYQQWLGTFPNPEEKLREITAKIPLVCDDYAGRDCGDGVVFTSGQASHVTGCATPCRWRVCSSGSRVDAER